MIKAIYLFFLLGSSVVHPLHVSVSEINYNGRNKSLEITLKVFIDDFENALSKRFDKEVKFGDNAEEKTFHPEIVKYINEQLNIKVSGEDAELEFLGKETDLEAVWLYFEAHNIEPFQEIAFRNTLFFELFDDQTNLIHLAYFDQKESVACRGNSAEQVINLE